jgi:hypothetical protein
LGAGAYRRSHRCLRHSISAVGPKIPSTEAVKTARAWPPFTSRQRHHIGLVDIQAFFRRLHQPRRPPPAKIRPGSRSRNSRRTITSARSRDCRRVPCACALSARARALSAEPSISDAWHWRLHFNLRLARIDWRSLKFGNSFQPPFQNFSKNRAW